MNTFKLNESYNTKFHSLIKEFDFELCISELINLSEMISEILPDFFVFFYHKTSLIVISHNKTVLKWSLLLEKLVGSKQFSRINGLKSWKLAVVQRWKVMERTGSQIYMRHVYAVFAFLIVHFHWPSIFSFLDRLIQSKLFN